MTIPNFSLENPPPTIADVVITEQMVYNKLRSLKIDKSPGPDGWPTVVLKEISDVICAPLSMIFKMSVQSGTLPESWQVGYVIPIHKSGSQQNPSTFRLVSLTSVIGKVLESLIRDVVLNHLLENNLMSPYQHGFLPQRSCCTQLITAMNHWTESLQQGYHTDVIYFDFCKAFDTVPHLRLLRKLDAYGISGNLLKWIKSFLTCRKQHVEINGQYSSWVFSQEWGSTRFCPGPSPLCHLCE